MAVDLQRVDVSGRTSGRLFCEIMLTVSLVLALRTQEGIGWLDELR